MLFKNRIITQLIENLKIKNNIFKLDLSRYAKFKCLQTTFPLPQHNTSQHFHSLSSMMFNFKQPPNLDPFTVLKTGNLLVILQNLHLIFHKRSPKLRPTYLISCSAELIRIKLLYIKDAPSCRLWFYFLLCFLLTSH